jgi:serine/threonine protein kinase
MEHLHGETLAQTIAWRGPLPAAEVVRMLEEVSRGLSAAHARGVLHRDIKPSNIFLAGMSRSSSTSVSTTSRRKNRVRDPTGRPLPVIGRVHRGFGARLPDEGAPDKEPLALVVDAARPCA